MKLSLAALCAGCIIDLLAGDPHSIPHPVELIGKLISFLERNLRKLLPKNPGGERAAGLILWLVTAGLSFALPFFILRLCTRLHPLAGFAAESIMCWQILAARSLRDESMKVYEALTGGSISDARRAVSMIVGRDTAELDDRAVARAAVETIAENSSDGVTAPLLFLAIGGAPLGFFYKAVNTMDSMLGYTEEPYKNIGFFPAKMDDIVNYIPSRLTGIFMLAAGFLMGLDVKNGCRIFHRDRRKHASPNSAQTEAACAGLLGIRLAGDAFYHGRLHKKEFIGDALREIEYSDIPLSCRLMFVTAFIAFAVFAGIKLIFII
ncbi:MAG: adenosylcobinamide-phosphate synthase CbiB [Candidatus Limivicinus sp.]|jgi:adenosylcobinamide-phosphate synthase